MDKQLKEEKAYRAQFEDKDSDLESFREERSSSPKTPSLKKNVFFPNLIACNSNKTEKDQAQDSLPTFKVMRQQSENVAAVADFLKNKLLLE